MSRYLLTRLVRLVLVWIGITLATFSLLRLSGDPARLILGELASAEAVRHNAPKIYALLVLQIWHELFLVQKVKSPPRVHLSDLFRVKVGAGR